MNLRKHIAVAGLLLLILVCALSAASAAVTISGFDSVDFQIGLPVDRPAGGGFFSRGVMFNYAINDNPTDNMNSTIIWSVAPVDGGPGLTITSDGEGRESTRAWLNLDPDTAYSAGGPYQYTLSMDINGMVTSKTVSVWFVNDQLPTGGYGLTTQQITFTSGSASLGAAVDMQNNEMYMVDGNTYAVTAWVTGTDFYYSTNERGWSDYVWEELNIWDDSRLMDLNLDGGKTGVYTAKEMGTYDHHYVVTFFGDHGSNIGCYIPYTLYVTDAQGNLPALRPELNGEYPWTAWYADDIDYTVYLGIGMNPDEGVWNRREFVNFWLTNYDQLQAEYGGAPVWNITAAKISGEDLDYEWREEGQHAWAMLRRMPATASETTVTVTCSWGGETTTKVIHVRAADPDFTVPAGITFQGLDTDGVYSTQKGQTIVIEPQLLPAGNTGVPGFSSHYFCRNNLWGFADRDWDYQSSSGARYSVRDAGTYEDIIGVSCGALMITKNVTFRVADENGNVPGPRLDNSGELWTYYLGLNEMMQGSVYGLDTLGQFRIPDNDRDYSLNDPVWSMVHIDGPDCFEMNDNSEHYGGEDINYIRSLSLKGSPAAGTARYTMTAAYNGKDYTADVIVNIENPNAVPTGMELRVAEFDESTQSVGQFTTLQSGDDLVLRTGTAYVLEGSYVGNWPGARDNQWLNFDWSEGWEEMDRWEYLTPTGEERFKGYNMVIRGGVPGTYNSGASLTIGSSNLEAFIPLTLKVMDENGNIPAPTLENGNSEWTWFTGLGGEWPGNGGLGSDNGIIQLRIPDRYWQGNGEGSPVWTITNNHDSAAGCYDFTYEVETWNDNRGISLRPAWSSADETVTGVNTYTITAVYQGVTFVSTETVIFRSDSYPTGMTMTVHEADLSTNTAGVEVPFTDGGFTLRAGKDYVFTSSYTGTVPGYDTSIYMNGGLDGALREYGRYDPQFITPDGSVWSDNQQVFAAVNPGTYDFQASLSIGMSNLVAIQHYTIRILDENEPEIGGYFSFTEGVDLSRTGTFYVKSGMPLDSDRDGVLYSTSNLFTFGVQNWWKIGNNYSGTPVLTVSKKSGNISYYTKLWNDGSQIDVFLTGNTVPDAGSAEFEVTCALAGKTYTQTVRIDFVTLSTEPAGVEVGYPNPIVRKVGDQVDFTPPVCFSNQWSIGGNSWSEYGGGNFWDHVDWEHGTWMDAGVYPLQLVARADNLCMNATVDAVVTKADGTLSAGNYTPYGTVFTLPAAITVIESEAFAGTVVTEADIPAGTQIAADAFTDTGLIAVYTHDDPDTIQWAVSNGIVALTDN